MLISNFFLENRVCKTLTLYYNFIVYNNKIIHLYANMQRVAILFLPCILHHIVEY